jgi:membrane-associated phospholipid phosphatase
LEAVSGIVFDMQDFLVWQLSFIEKLHAIRCPLVDVFFKCLNFFDTQPFAFILIPAIWLGYSWKAGARLFYILALSSMCSFALKMFFALPRPFQLDPSLGVITVEGYGFPSGGAQTAVLLGGLIIYTFKKKWAWIVGLNYFFWISLSRLYLGVHFPMDVVGGWVVGSILLAGYVYVRPWIEKRLHTWNLVSLLCLSEVIPLALLSSGYFIQVCTAAMGVGFGLFLASRNRLSLPLPKTVMQAFARALLGVGGTFIFYYTLSVLPIEPKKVHMFAKHFLVGLWLSVGAAVVWKNMRMKAC